MKLTVECNAINERNTFSNGDVLTGQLIVEVSKKTTIKSLTIKAKGKASVAWTETHGEQQVTYWDEEKYFSQTESILPNENSNGSFTLSPGRHTFPFVVQLPSNDLPSSFKGESGKVKYHLLAQLSRSLRVPSKAKTEFAFVSRPDALLPVAMAPQYGVKDRNVTFFASGNISMNIFLEKTGYQQGEHLIVKGEIVNSSTRKIVPKYIIYQKQSFFAQGNRTVHTSNIVKEKDAALSSSTRQTVSKILTVPWGATPTILNCRILKVEYRLKVILDVSFTKNPEIKLPLVILPACDGAMAKALEACQPQKTNYVH
ncbi:arrestin domain-containing protein 3 [Salminus brasiliensis]|uniref:arrestin domain-containing protein 3 n=1 Tax=Salminus brasiliensis TaxID=930266 RepID=UPI003B832A4F